MAAGKALGPLCGGGDRRLGFERDEGELPRLGLGVLPAVAAAGHPGLWLRVFSSRKLERATYDSVAFRFIAANQHPDHDTIAAFRRRFLQEIEGLFVQVLAVAREMGVLKMGTGRHQDPRQRQPPQRALIRACGPDRGATEGRSGRVAGQGRGRADLPDGLSIPDELARREERLAKLAEARATIEARARERFEREQAEHEAKLAARDAKAEATGRKPRGKPPQPPVEGPRPTDQVNLTDEESRIMPVAGGGFEQCYNAQAVVVAGSLLVVAADVVQAPNDKRQLAPMLDKLAVLPADLGQPETLLADNGYFSAANVETCQAAGIEPLIALGREGHHPSLGARFAEAPPAPENPTPVEAMVHRLKTLEGRKLYAQRKHIPEPVFGIIKSVLGFRQFLLRGLNKVRGEWNLVTMAWNLKRMFALIPTP